MSISCGNTIDTKRFIIPFPEYALFDEPSFFIDWYGSLFINDFENNVRNISTPANTIAVIPNANEISTVLASATKSNSLAVILNRMFPANRENTKPDRHPVPVI